MAYVAPEPDDLTTFLGSSVDDARAQLILDIAETKAKLIADPLPDVAKGVVLSAAARVYSNPAQATSDTAGPFNVGRPFPSVFFTKAERSDIRRGAGQGGGAFTIDPTPADAMDEYIDPLAHPTADESEKDWLDNPLVL